MSKNIKWSIASVAVLFVIPFLTAKFAGRNGMVFCFIMFFVLNPIFFITEGVSLGTYIRKCWLMPFISALIYLLSMWAVFEFGEIDFVIYSGVYLVIGVVVMLITASVYGRKR